MASLASTVNPSPRFASAPDEKLGAHGDVVIVGAGLAGLFTALKLAPMHVTVLAAAPLGEGASSNWARVTSAGRSSIRLSA